MGIHLDNHFKETEVGLIPADWDVTRLGDIITVHDKSRIPLNSKERQAMQGEYPYCGANGIVDYVNDFLFDGEYVLLAEDGGYWGPFDSSAYVMNGKFWVNNHAHIIKGYPELTSNLYLMSILNFLDLTGYVSGSTRGKLTQGTMKNIEIPLPPLPEQRRIAAVLNAIQEAIAAQEDVIAEARAFKRSLMQRLFIYGPGPVPAETKETEIGEIPAHWKVLPLGKVITLQRGFDLPKQQRTTGTIPIVSSSGVSGSHVEAKVQGPGVVTGRYGTIGEVFYIEDDFWPLNTTLWVREFNGNNQKFVSYLLTTVNLSSLNDKTSIPGINRNHVHQLLVGLPPVDEQADIVQQLEAVEAKIAAEEDRKVALQDLFKATLHQLMTGQVRLLGDEGVLT